MVTTTAAAHDETAAADTALPDDTKQSKKVSFSGIARVSSDEPVNGEVPLRAAEAGENPESKHWTPLTDETSDAFSGTTNSSDVGDYEVIEYDPNDNEDYPLDLLQEIEPTIEENTPAAEALRANAGVHVSSVGKAARAVNIQAVRKFVKRTTGRQRSGVVRGKPPRIPPHLMEDDLSVEAVHSDEYHTGLEPIDETEPQRDSAGHQKPPDDENAAIPDSVVAGTVEAGKKVLGEVDPHGMLKLLRWRRKKRGHVKKPKSYVKGKVIDGEHELYTLSIAVMIGVRTSISKTNTILNAGSEKRWIQPQDFRTTEKYEFRPKGGTTPPHQLAHTFKFKDYSPIVFAYLRRMYGVNEFDFLLSVCGNANFIEFISNAKSGQFFFYSSDGKYMIKTMTNAESKFLRRILPQYFRHCAENPNTMITRFFGMYRVKLYHLRRNVKFVIMNSVYYTDKYLQSFYDLKGSVIGRDAKPGQAVKKDNDLRRELPEGALTMAPVVRTTVRQQLMSDCNFLEHMDIMDYSMLVGVHHVPAQEDSSIAKMGWKGMRRRKNPSDHDLDDSESSLGYDVAAVNAEAGKHHRGQSTNEHLLHRTDPSHLHGRKVVSEPHLHVAGLPERGVVSDRHVAGLPETGVALERLDGATESGRRRQNSPGDQVGAFFLDDGLDDDESSYLRGSEKRDDEDVPTSFNEETEKKKLATIAKLYWPFHRLFDIHGYRLTRPSRCPVCGDAPCTCGDDDEILKGYNIPKFIPPLSDRKDGGLEMDRTGLHLPKKFHGPHGDQLYEGKIFYMGIIDVLQEYTARKKLEAKYRWLQTSGKQEASCTHPEIYGERFIQFFDEYSQRFSDPNDVGVELDAELGIQQSESKMAEH